MMRDALVVAACKCVCMAFCDYLGTPEAAAAAAAEAGSNVGPAHILWFTLKYLIRPSKCAAVCMDTYLDRRRTRHEKLVSNGKLIPI